jgi:hypothetical protein
MSQRGHSTPSQQRWQRSHQKTWTLVQFYVAHLHRLPNIFAIRRPLRANDYPPCLLQCWLLTVVGPTTQVFHGFSRDHTLDPNNQQRAVLAGLLPRHTALSLSALRPKARGGNRCCPSPILRTLVQKEASDPRQFGGWQQGGPILLRTKGGSEPSSIA